MRLTKITVILSFIAAICYIIRYFADFQDTKVFVFACVWLCIGFLSFDRLRKSKE